MNSRRIKKAQRRVTCSLTKCLYGVVAVAFTIHLYFIFSYCEKRRLKKLNDLKQISGSAINSIESSISSFNDNRNGSYAKSKAKSTIAYGEINKSLLQMMIHELDILSNYNLFLKNNKAVSITSCKADNIGDAAAILKHSIQLSSYPSNKDSLYGFQMVAFVHPDAKECIEPFRQLNYEVHLKDVPIDVSKIKGDFLREKVTETGCCGEKEYLKLYAYTLVEFEIVVHLDLDSLILQPLDNLFDSMLLKGDEKNASDSKLPVMHNASVPQEIEAYFTRDYNMANLGKNFINIQGGFFVVKPNLEYFEEYKNVILEGNFKPGAGWEGKYGGYFGAQQIQGLCTYFFDGLHPGTAVELNRCIYNNMNDNPKKEKSRKENTTFVCRDNKETCDDCRETDFSIIKSAHFTLCQKPWVCPKFILDQRLCGKFHQRWFSMREDFEKQENIFDATLMSKSKFQPDVFRGYCKGGGNKNYVSMNFTAFSS